MVYNVKELGKVVWLLNENNLIFLKSFDYRMVKLQFYPSIIVICCVLSVTDVYFKRCKIIKATIGSYTVLHNTHVYCTCTNHTISTEPIFTFTFVVIFWWIKTIHLHCASSIWRTQMALIWTFSNIWNYNWMHYLNSISVEKVTKCD